MTFIVVLLMGGGVLFIISAIECTSLGQTVQDVWSGDVSKYTWTCQNGVDLSGVNGALSAIGNFFGFVGGTVSAVAGDDNSGTAAAWNALISFIKQEITGGDWTKVLGSCKQPPSYDPNAGHFGDFVAKAKAWVACVNTTLGRNFSVSTGSGPPPDANVADNPKLPPTYDSYDVSRFAFSPFPPSSGGEGDMFTP